MSIFIGLYIKYACYKHCPLHNNFEIKFIYLKFTKGQLCYRTRYILDVKTQDAEKSPRMSNILEKSINALAQCYL